MQEVWVVVCHWIYLDEDEIKAVFKEKEKAIKYAKKIAEEEIQNVEETENKIILDLGENWIEIVKSFLY